MAAARAHPIGTASVACARALLAYARRCGLDADVLASDAGVDPARLDDPDARLPLSTDRRLWLLLADLSGDPALGVHFAAQVELGTFEALDYAIWCSANVGDALGRLMRFYRLLADDLALRVVLSQGAVRLVRESADDVAPRAEAYLALLVARTRSLAAALPEVREVRFRHARHGPVRPCRMFFRCPVGFGATTTELVVSTASLERPIASGRPGLAAILDRYMHDLLARLPSPDSFARRVHEAVARSLHGGRPSVTTTAQRLHVSRRTLQRRLRELGLDHGEIVDAVRRDLAGELLAQPRLAIGEIAYLLGFENVSGFHKAYKRWHGVAPSRRRKRS